MKTNRILALVLMVGITAATTVRADEDERTTPRPTVEEAYAGPGTITAIGDLQPGRLVTVVGRVTRVDDDDELYIDDDTGQAEIYFRRGMPRVLRVTVNIGDTLTVHGRVDDDRFPGRRREIYAYTVEIADGTVVPVE